MATNDALLGRLEFNGVFWSGTTGLLMLNEPLRLSVEGEAKVPPGKPERLAFKRFQALHPNVHLALERAIFGYYQEVLPIYREAMGDLADELAPVLTDSSLIWPMLSCPSVHIPKQSKVWGFEYHFESRWDVEHGLRVMVREGPLFGVDIQNGPGWEHVLHVDAAGQSV